MDEMKTELKQYKKYFLLDNSQVIDSDIFIPELYRIFDTPYYKWKYRILKQNSNTDQLDDNLMYKNSKCAEMYLFGPDHVNWVIMESDDRDGLLLFKRLNNV